MNWNRNIATVVAGLVLIFVADLAFADLRVSGAVSGTWTTQDARVFVTGDITIARNETLTIEPGVSVEFQGNYRLTVNGTLRAIGTEQDTIRIFGGANPGSWIGLIFVGPGSDQSVVTYCSIRYAYQGISLDDSDPTISNSWFSLCNNAGMSFNRSAANVSYCDFYRTTGSAIKIGGSSRPVIRYCNILLCGNNGIVVNESAAPVLDHNIIDGVNDIGIVLSSAAACSVKFNKIIRPGDKGISVSESNGVILMRNVSDGSAGPGAILYRSAGTIFVNNTCINSGGHGLQISNNVSGTVENNILENSDLNGIWMAQGSSPTCNYNNIYNSHNGHYNGVQEGRNDMHVPSNLDMNYNPREGNALIDAGDPGMPRDPDGTRAEIGAGFFNQNHPPEIRSFSPDWPIDTTIAPDTIAFTAEVVDPDNNFLTFRWYVNGQDMWHNVSYSQIFNRDGSYEVRMVVSDSYYLGVAEHIWRFNIEGSTVKTEPDLPVGYALSEVYPNPFNSTTKMSLTLPRNELVKVDLIALDGRLIGNIYESFLNAGSHQISADLSQYSTGEYLLRVELGTHAVVRRCLLVR